MRKKKIGEYFFGAKVIDNTTDLIVSFTKVSYNTNIRYKGIPLTDILLQQEKFEKIYQPGVHTPTYPPVFFKKNLTEIVLRKTPEGMKYTVNGIEVKYLHELQYIDHLISKYK